MTGIGDGVGNSRSEGGSMSPGKGTRKSAGEGGKSGKSGQSGQSGKRGKKSGAEDAFTAEERSAMKERAREVRAAARGGAGGKSDGEADVLAKIAEMPDRDRAMAERLHGLIRAAAPELTCRTWYGMPAYAKDGDVICFFQSAQKFKARYATLGFSDKAGLDEDAMWPTSFALMELTPAVEARIEALVEKAVG